tara:strand:+ start:28 stop:405 length:378 start_codon:yes stop_codon:yes gene_type:complete
MAKGKLVADEIEHSTQGTVNTQYVVEGTAKVIITFDATAVGSPGKSHNVSSVDDDAVGRFSINVTSGFSDLNIVVVAGNGDHAVHNAGANTNEVTNSSKYKHVHWENNAEVDMTDMNNAAFGDLA